jgi:hypothetical protein
MPWAILLCLITLIKNGNDGEATIKDAVRRIRKYPNRRSVKAIAHHLRTACVRKPTP